MSRSQKLAILGTSGFAREVLDLAEDAGFEVEFFVENLDRSKTDKPLFDRPVIWIDDAASRVETHRVICSLGTTKRKGFIEQAAQLGFEFATVVHPLARVSSMSTVGTGSLLSVGVVVASGTVLGRHVILNRGAMVGHDTVVGDCVTISPGANIAGLVTVEDGCYIGMGAVIVDRVRIGSGSVVAAGSVVVKDVPDGVQVMGVPARIVKEGITGR